nr:F-box only protein 4-like isoform X2 [Oncorhynchus nerka]
MSIITCCMCVCRAGRKRASVKQQSLSSNLLILERTDQSGQLYFSPAPQVQEVCQEVDEFIYVANAETRRGWFHQATFQDQIQGKIRLVPPGYLPGPNPVKGGEGEASQIQALVDPA